MERREFIRFCGMTCLSAGSVVALLSACSSAKPIAGIRSGNSLVINEEDFAIQGKSRFRHSVLVQQEGGFPIIVYRLNEKEYSALLMKCTHQGQELNANGDQLSCSAHGSEFDNRGQVLQGPAEHPLISYKTRIENGKIFIDLA